MTPQDKAKELVEKYTFSCRECDYAKQCALIAVDELIKHCVQVEPYLGVDYWHEVKTEIEKI